MTEIAVRVVDDQLTDQEMDDVLHDLLDELRELGVDGGRETVGPAPAHTRGTELVETALVVLQGIVESGVARMVAERVQGWFARSGVNQVEVTIGSSRLALTNATAEQQDRLVDHFVKATEAER